MSKKILGLLEGPTTALPDRIRTMRRHFHGISDISRLWARIAGEGARFNPNFRH